jgi:signal transduction histidine kinase
MSLRRQFILWYAITMPLLIFALVFTARHIMVTNLRMSLDDSLHDRTQMIVSDITDNLGNGNASYSDAVSKAIATEELPTLPLILRASDLQGNQLAVIGHVPDTILRSMNTISSSLESGHRFDTIKIKGVDQVRVYTVSVSDPTTQEPFALIQMGDSLRQVNAAESRLWWYTLGEGFGGSLLTILLGIFILSRGLRPLDRIIDEAHEMQSSQLQMGLPQEPRPPELQRLADSLNSMWRRLDEAIKGRETFVASVSHDLRTPLTALQGQIEVLLMRKDMDFEAKESLQRMAGEVRRLVRMTNNLLLNAQLESKPVLALEQVNLKELLGEIVGEVCVLAEGINLTVSSSEDEAVSGDRDLLKEMLVNVVDNAIKSTPKGGRIEMAIVRDNNWAVIEVIDSGRGISPEHLPHVMEPFYKAGNKQKRTGRRAGLGLTIVKQIVELHNGQVEIQSQEGVGTRVRIRLPISTADGTGKP